MKPRRRAGLQAPALEPQLRQALAQRVRGVLADPAARNRARADVDQPVQERARRDHERAAAQQASVVQHDPRHRAALQTHVVRDPGETAEPRQAVQQTAHLGGVARLVTLRARRPHRRAPAAVQHLELNAGAVGHDPHHAAHRVQLAHHVPLRDPADRGVARHARGVGEAHGEERGVEAEPDAGAGGLAAGMAGADHDDVILDRVLKHRYLLAHSEAPGAYFGV